MADADPWRAWSDLAGAAWRHQLTLPGATLASEVTGLEERDGVWTWTVDRIWRSPAGLILVRQSRNSAGAEDDVVVLIAATHDELVRATDEALGRTPGLVELYGRAGIEVGLLPDDQLEGDEIDDWPSTDPPP